VLEKSRVAAPDLALERNVQQRLWERLGQHLHTRERDLDSTQGDSSLKQIPPPD